MKTIKLYIIDDEDLILKSLTELFNVVDGFEVVGFSKSGMNSLDNIISVDPDIVLLDLKLHGENGFELTKELKQKAPGIKVIILSGYCNESLIAMAMQNGASGYLTKGISFEEFVDSLNKVIIVGSFIVCNIYKPYLERIKSEMKLDVNLFILTRREKEILELIAKEYTTSSIAQKLGISEKTVRNHKSNIMHKLNLSTDAALVKYAFYMAII